MYAKQTLDQVEDQLINALLDSEAYVGDVLELAIANLDGLRPDHCDITVTQARQVVKLCQAGIAYLRTGGQKSDEFVRGALLIALQECDPVAKWNKLTEAHRQALATKQHAKAIVAPPSVHEQLRFAVRVGPTTEARKATELLFNEVIHARCPGGPSRCRAHDLHTLAVHGRVKELRERAQAMIAAEAKAALGRI